MDLPQKGEDEHILGFILNKLYLGRYWVKPGKKPKKHTSVKNIPKSYPAEFRGKFSKNLNWLVKKGLVSRFPHSGDRERHVCAVLDPNAQEIGLPICNKYRLSVGLPELDDRFKEIIERNE